ncbi:MAG: glycoside hydrolase family 31 protein [Verrucomicrobiota bacterium]
MSKPNQTRAAALSPNHAQSVLLHNDSERIELSALSDDLFRLRMTHGPAFSPLASWAICQTDWPEVSVDLRQHRGTASVQTSQGQLTFAHGGWQLRDRGGQVVFSSPPRGTAFSGTEPSVVLELEEKESIFALGESSGPFNKRGLIREFWNIDVGGHTRAVHAALRNMYLSVPFALSLRHGRAAGLFWDNPTRQKWDLGQTTFDQWKMTASNGEIDLYLFLGPTCPDVLRRYTKLTGRMPLPPQWALGYQQCRYSYETRRRVEEIARTFRAKQIPCDVLYLDIHYMDEYRVFTFGRTFPNPRRMIAGLGKSGFKVVTIVDPGVKDDQKFPVLQRGLQRKAFVKDRSGRKDYLGQVWPGRVRFPDFLNPAARAWWSEEQARFQRLGIAGFWNDMNEPADFSAPGKDFPGECLHQVGPAAVRHASVHNVYGSEMARASFEGALAAAPNRRPFVITRAGYAGLQKHALVWTGDNDSTWEHLADSVQMLLNLGLSGIAFCGADVGGFHHNTTGELLARWTQLAAFTPFFRNHSNIGTIDQEPWAFGPKIESICRRFIQLRYQLLPYLSGLFREAHREGIPVMRPLLWHYPNDPKAVAAGDQFLLGADLLVAPILRQGATARSVYLPAGTWFDFWTGAAHRGGAHLLAEADLDSMPIYVRAGAIIPFLPVQQYVGEKAGHEVTLHLWPGNRGDLSWYEDDGLSRDYEKGVYYQRRLSMSKRNRRTRLCFEAPQGRGCSHVRRWRVLLRNCPRAVRPQLSGEPLALQFDRETSLCSFGVANETAPFEVNWV